MFVASVAQQRGTRGTMRIGDVHRYFSMFGPGKSLCIASVMFMMSMASVCWRAKLESRLHSAMLLWTSFAQPMSSISSTAQQARSVLQHRILLPELSARFGSGQGTGMWLTSMQTQLRRTKECGCGKSYDRLQTNFGTRCHLPEVKSCWPVPSHTRWTGALHDASMQFGIEFEP